MIVPAPHLEPGASSARSAAPAKESPAAAAVAIRSPASTPVETADAVQEAVAAINRAAKSLNNSVQLDLDARSKHPVVRVVDSETGQLIRQIPSEEVLELRRALDRIAGLLIHRTA